ncbi:hypothetical protein B9G69_006900 [Bdellovibrio sp. SKB1291214]|uniref:hypothetical protein n=1 Tax=Bdellovibrio sp. SKB1291214 TaxID=1732569 RepID=UPI001C3CCB5C|nr:hypothetical protein [Bdellovibrio sp. SKB1291214]UYL10306.1 hypothetical protein B9G69_006900 [Bdellovibrio sp. SKB1291214]
MAVVIGICIMFIGAVGVVSERLEFSVNREVIKASVLALLWLGLGTFLTYTKVFQFYPYPIALAYFTLVLVVSFGVALSSYGNRLALGLSLSALVLFQGFRLPLEVILHRWAQQGTMPFTMTWTGYNFDVLAGILALVIAPIANRHKGAVWFFNIVGIILAFNAVYVGVMSSPLPFAWDIEPRLLLLYHIPYFLVMPVCVGGAIAGHVILTKALLYKA